MAPFHRITKHFNAVLLRSVLLIFLSTMNYGFDNQGFNTTQAMIPFKREFGVLNPKTHKYILEPYWLSLFNSLNYIGFAAGILIGSYVSSRWGRRMCMFAMSCWALCGAAITITANNRDHILAGRVLSYIYIGMELSVMPVFMSEIVPAPIRGFCVGSYQFSLVTGGFIVNIICRGTSTLPTNAAWRIPIGLFFVIPTIVLSLVWFIPESPRWLLTKGRDHEALVAFTKFRKGCITDDEITIEFESLQRGLLTIPEQGKFKELFQGVNRKRTAIVVGMNFFQQVTGQAFVSTYSAVFVSGLDTINPFDFTVINLSCNLVVMSIGLYFNDVVGRRPLLLIGGSIQMVAILIVGCLGTVPNPSYAVRNTIVAFVVLFGLGFIFAWAPLTYVVTTEVPALRLRDRSQRLAAVVNVVFQFLVNFSIPYLLYAPYADLGSRVGFIFGSLSFCAVVFTWFCVPECKGKTLEQVDYMFQTGVPLRKFGSYRFAATEGDASSSKGVLWDVCEVRHEEKMKV
ncbi:hypothetical protein ONS95_003485 [Cadophora gregata]|uniref:uncharacterized protein n=1 Tax=Cadophora gregata TaxID=51156 RepID=UPI0026DC318F|nr:uncharacterized protein ONS95_003485 [Cadophora gregata]KAK0108694.1 hypothetical protein ONS95_003485 [Cadophora gregata]KAK0108716.1 hypothetical protein ONS96_002563 [Cadophora gregata f. sp. sojae]